VRILAVKAESHTLTIRSDLVFFRHICRITHLFIQPFVELLLSVMRF
jgi:hypothetical protein